MDKVISNLKEVRTEKNISNKELSANTGISIRCLQYYEDMTNTPSILNAYRLAAYLDIPVEELFTYETNIEEALKKLDHS